uniref:Transmembrane protein n=1 Tax=Elaeophora elaphi TaxID=1147741 RepID=A0A0R3S0N1_9BILA
MFQFIKGKKEERWSEWLSKEGMSSMFSFEQYPGRTEETTALRASHLSIQALMATVRPPSWCISKIPILKWLQLVCCLIVVIFLSDGRYQWFVYTVIFFISILLIMCTFLTLLLIYVDVKNVYNIEVIFNLIAFSLCLLAGSLLTYDLMQMISASYTHHRYLPPIYIGKDSWTNRIAVCTVNLLNFSESLSILQRIIDEAVLVIFGHYGIPASEHTVLSGIVCASQTERKKYELVKPFHGISFQSYSMFVLKAIKSLPAIENLNRMNQSIAYFKALPSVKWL